MRRLNRMWLVTGTGETVRPHYAYDAWNRMVGVYADDQGQPGAAQCTYGYDGLHRQVWRTPVGMPAHYYYNESWQLVEEVYGLSTTQHVWDVRYIDAAVCSDRDGNHDGDCEDAATGVQGSNEGDRHLYYMQDANFNVTGLVDGYDGAVLQRYSYDPYGKPTVLHGVRDSQGTDTSASEWQARTTFTLGNEFLYCGYRYDPLAGHYRVRYRVYHPTLGRWTARDPIGYKGGMSLLAYVASRPVSHADAMGLYGGGLLGTDPIPGSIESESLNDAVNQPPPPKPPVRDTPPVVDPVLAHLSPFGYAVRNLTLQHWWPQEYHYGPYSYFAGRIRTTQAYRSWIKVNLEPGIESEGRRLADLYGRSEVYDLPTPTEAERRADIDAAFATFLKTGTYPPAPAPRSPTNKWWLVGKGIPLSGEGFDLFGNFGSAWLDAQAQCFVSQHCRIRDGRWAMKWDMRCDVSFILTDTWEWGDTGIIKELNHVGKGIPTSVNWNDAIRVEEIGSR